MSKIGIFYGSSTGNTRSAAEQIGQKLGVDSADIHDVCSANPNDFKSYDVLLLGSSTWGIGDLQDDWEGFDFSGIDFSGKQVALFGCGDASSYSDSFCDAVGKLYNAVKDSATVIGLISTDGYSFDLSEAVEGDKFVGLIIDEDNESELTEARIESWIEQLKGEMNQPVVS